MGRNPEKLARLTRLSERVEVVPITGDVEQDTAALKKHGPIEAYFDISPPEAAETTHLKSGILALRHGGRVSLMGGIMGDVVLPYGWIMFFDIQVKGKFMYQREDITALIQMVRTGVLKLDQVEIVGKFGLGEWEKAFEVAKEKADLGQIVLMTP